MKKHILIFIGAAFLMIGCGKSSSPEQEINKLMAELEAKQKPILDKMWSVLEEKIDKDSKYTPGDFDTKEDKKEKEKNKKTAKERIKTLLLGSFEEVVTLLKKDLTNNKLDDKEQACLLMNPSVANFAYRDPIKFFRTLALELSSGFAEMMQAGLKESMAEAESKGKEEIEKVKKENEFEILMADYLTNQAEYYKRGTEVTAKK